jgi:hypothetical protein
MCHGREFRGGGGDRMMGRNQEGGRICRGPGRQGGHTGQPQQIGKPRDGLAEDLRGNPRFPGAGN